MTRKTRLTGAQVILKYLINEGVPYVLGIFGHGNVQLGEALAEHKDKIRFVQVKNEQNAVHIAAGYAKMTGRPLAVTTSIGPGCTNLVTGAALCRVNRLPVLLLPGDAFSDAVGPVLQQIEGNNVAESRAVDTLVPVSKYWTRISRAIELQKRLPEAFDTMMEPGNQGPATLVLPMDVQAEATHFDLEVLMRPRDKNWERIRPDPLAIRRAVDLILKAKRPIIIAGGGVIRSGAMHEVKTFAKMISAPVIHTQAGNGVLLFTDELNAFSAGPSGSFVGNRLAPKADLVIGIGTRYSDFTTGSETLFARDTQFININISHVDVGKERATKLLGDAQMALREIIASLGSRHVEVAEARGERRVLREELAELRTEWIKEQDRLRSLGLQNPMAQSEVIGIVNDFCDIKDVVVSAAGSLPGDLLKLWRCKDPTAKGYHIEYGYSCMGYEISGAIGAKLADPAREVYAMVGDATFLMAPQELFTAVQEGIKITVILVDNHGPQCIRGLQSGNGFQEFGNEFRYRDPYTGTLSGKYISVNFLELARGFGAPAIKAKSRYELERALAWAKKITTRPAFIYVETDPECRVPSYGGWWDVPRPEVTDRPELKKQLRQYRRMKAKQVVR